MVSFYCLHLTHLQPVFHFYTPRWPYVFRGYRSGTLIENGLTVTVNYIHDKSGMGNLMILTPAFPVLDERENELKFFFHTFFVVVPQKVL